MDLQPLDETVPAREMLRRLSDPEGILARAAHVLKLVAHSSIGLGEVLQDFAVQGYAQLEGIVRAAADVSNGAPGHPEDAESLRHVHYTLKSVKSVLERIPAAMQRNKSDALGEKEKLSRADITQITHAFLHSPDISSLLASEDSGQTLAVLALDAGGLPSGAGGQPQLLFAASH